VPPPPPPLLGVPGRGVGVRWALALSPLLTETPGDCDAWEGEALAMLDALQPPAVEVP